MTFEIHKRFPVDFESHIAVESEFGFLVICCLNLNIGDFMKSIIVKAQAKINLSLDVLNKRQDGYHDVKMIMQSIELHDIVELKKINKGIQVVCRNAYVPEDRTNTAYRAAALLGSMFGIDGIRIYIIKNIPVAAGLGGGSGDAAAVFHGINKLFSLDLPLDKLMKISANIGADIPFCIKGGTAIAEGIGEIITSIAPLQAASIVLVKPRFGVSTRWVYKNLNLDKIKKRPDTKKLVRLINSGDIKNVAENMINVLESVTMEKYEELKSIKDRLLEYGAMGSMMSGSGPTVFGIFNCRENAKKAARIFESKGYRCFLTST